MDKITIVFIFDMLDIGGTERQFLETVRHLNRNRFVPKVLAFSCFGKLREEVETLDISFTCLDFSGLAGKFRPKSYLQLWGLFRKMTQYFRREKPHIVQCYLFWANIYGCLAAKIAGVPIIITGRREIPDNDSMRLHYRWLQNLSNFWASAIVANSHGAKQQCLKQERYVDDEKINVIYNGIDLSKYTSYCKTENKERIFHIPDDHFVIGIIARLRRYKGHRDFLEAAALVAQTYPKTTFLIIGMDEEGIQADLETLAKGLHISDSIIFVGERSDIPEILSMLDIQVSASLTESASNAILEGMAAGKPIVATNVGGTAELVIHEHTGLLVPPQNPACMADAIMRLLDDPVLRSQLGNNGRHRTATLFPMEHMIARTEALYKELYEFYKSSKQDQNCIPSRYA
jgi:glycosyltransferase involved in cell wall biosynthesis